MTVTRVAILGATGSIGTQALDVAERYPQDLQAVALAAGSDAARMRAAVARAPGASIWMSTLGADSDPSWLTGDESLRALVTDPGVDAVLVAGGGARSLRAALWAVSAGKRLALATKEVLVLGGSLIMPAAHASGAQVLPVDSEHSALWQCLAGENPADVRRLWLTASGGPFLDASPDGLQGVTPAQAVAHPRWSMGAKISVDSATLMNKGLEIIEAHWLFAVGVEQVGVAVHRQSLAHGLVEFVDGSFKAQLSATDMRLPIALALTHPRRLAGVVPALSPPQLGQLTFEPLDEARFPAVPLARAAGLAGGSAPAILNAANEAAVAAFLAGGLGFTEIVPLVAAALQEISSGPVEDLEQVLEIDARARRWVRERLARPTTAVARAGR